MIAQVMESQEKEENDKKPQNLVKNLEKPNFKNIKKERSPNYF